MSGIFERATWQPYFTAWSLLSQKIYTLLCLAVMLVVLLAIYYGYHKFTHFLKNNSGGNGLTLINWPSFWHPLETRHFLSNSFRSILDTVQVHWSLLSIRGWRLPIEISALNNPGTQAITNWFTCKQMMLGSCPDPANSTSKYSDLLPDWKCLPGHSLIYKSSVVD